MAKIMTNLELINRMKELLNEPNFYGSGGNKWSSWQDGKGWYVDCTCSIKAILWGGRFIPANRGKAHAGCSYRSNDVPDFTPASCVEWTNATKGNFKNLIPGEILLMTSHRHAGLYIGSGEVIEVTPAWTGGTPGCQVSQIGSNGERIKNGRKVLSWEYHGKIPVIDYSSSTTPAEPSKEKTIDELAREVIAGKYGNGEARKKALGDRYREVQDRVNQILRESNSFVYKTISNCYWLNLRTSSSYGNNIYKAVPAGTKVEYLGMESGWAKIKYDNKILYCGNGYLN